MTNSASSADFAGGTNWVAVVTEALTPIIAIPGEMIITKEQWAAMQPDKSTDAETES